MNSPDGLPEREALDREAQRMATELLAQPPRPGDGVRRRVEFAIEIGEQRRAARYWIAASGLSGVGLLVIAAIAALTSPG